MLGINKKNNLASVDFSVKLADRRARMSVAKDIRSNRDQSSPWVGPGPEPLSRQSLGRAERNSQRYSRGNIYEENSPGKYPNFRSPQKIPVAQPQFFSPSKKRHSNNQNIFFETPGQNPQTTAHFVSTSPQKPTRLGAFFTGEERSAPSKITQHYHNENSNLGIQEITPFTTTPNKYPPSQPAHSPGNQMKAYPPRSDSHTKYQQLGFFDSPQKPERSLNDNSFDSGLKLKNSPRKSRNNQKLHPNTNHMQRMPNPRDIGYSPAPRRKEHSKNFQEVIAESNLQNLNHSSYDAANGMNSPKKENYRRDYAVTQPPRSILRRRGEHGQKPRRNIKFNPQVLVHSIESYKRFNVDMGKEAKRRFKQENGCNLF